MTLSFTQKIGSEPNYFIQQIWNNIVLDTDLVKEYGNSYAKYSMAYADLFSPQPKPYVQWDHLEGDEQQKKHSMRVDKSDRWKVGMKIHPVINNRHKNRFQFAPTMIVKSIQKIKIEELGIETRITIDGNHFDSIFHTGVFCPSRKLIDLANNDGFRSSSDFLHYFNGEFEGKIIHWTNLKY